MLDHTVSAQQLMFLYLYLVYLYQFVKKKKKKVSTQSLHCLLCVLFGCRCSLKMYSARCILKSVTR